jgi:gamma-glutamyl hydrolase
MSPQTFRSNPKLASLWAITSTNEDRLGRPFVSTLEPLRQQFPYYGVQYHPEKNAFEYGFQAGTSIPYEAISHSFDAVRFSLHVAQFAVELAREGRRDRIRDRSDDCRRPRHEYTDPERFPPMYTYPVRSGLLPGFEQVYIVPPASAWPPPPAAPRPLGETAESAPLPASLLDSTASSSASTS